MVGRQGTYSSLADGALAELVEVNEEFLEADAVAGNARLDALLNVLFVAQLVCLPLVVALVSVVCPGHKLDAVAHL